jgi:GNAT superfamily N-acetyltransferase
MDNTEVRQAGSDDADVVARLLDAFNTEFGTSSPGAGVLARRLRQLLGGTELLALLIGVPAVGVAVISLRRNVWFGGPVALLDELYVQPDRRNGGLGTILLEAAEDLARAHGSELLEINVDGEDHDARRFYERHGFADRDPGQSEPQLYYSREL